MILIQYKEDGTVIDTVNLRHDAAEENTKVVESIPAYVPKEGYMGVLKYNDENGLFWEYVEAPKNTELTVQQKAEAYDIITGVSE